jgi:hypothetical protein
MAVEIRPSKKCLLHGSKQIKEFLKVQKEKQNWIYYLIIGSFVSIVILNHLFPDVYWVEPKPALSIKSGFLGVILMFFGTIFFIRAFFLGGTDWYWVLSIVLCVVLLYFGIPLLFG